MVGLGEISCMLFSFCGMIAYFLKYFLLDLPFAVILVRSYKLEARPRFAHGWIIFLVTVLSVCDCRLPFVSGRGRKARWS